VAIAVPPISGAGLGLYGLASDSIIDALLHKAGHGGPSTGGDVSTD
jgi:hypothetical protein